MHLQMQGQRDFFFLSRISKYFVSIFLIFLRNLRYSVYSRYLIGHNVYIGGSYQASRKTCLHYSRLLPPNIFFMQVRELSFQKSFIPFFEVLQCSANNFKLHFWDYSFSIYTKFSKKLTFLTVSLIYPLKKKLSSKECQFFRKFFVGAKWMTSNKKRNKQISN